MLEYDAESDMTVRATIVEFAVYGENIYTYYNDGFRSLAGFYLVKKTGKSGAELAQYIYDEIQAGDAIT